MNAPIADDQDLFERIWYAQRDGRIELGADLKLLNKPGSPVFRAHENILPWVALICLAIVGWRLAGWVGALAAAASMVVLIATTINFAVMNRLRKRSIEYAMSGMQGLDALWAAGALSLRMAGEADGEIRGPGQSWRAFAAKRLPPTKAERRG